MGWAKPLIAVMTVVAAISIVTEASAQQTPQGRDCQTVRTCNFTRTGAVRGCLSSYTCRTCRLVPTRCDVGGVAATCRAVRCSWGG